MASKEIQLTQEKISQILSQGTVLTMKEDLEGVLGKGEKKEIPQALEEKIAAFRKAEEIPKAPTKGLEKPPGLAIPEKSAPKAAEIAQEIPEEKEAARMQEQQRQAMEEQKRQEQEKERETADKKRILSAAEAEEAKRKTEKQKKAAVFLVKKEDREAMRRKLLGAKRQVLEILASLPEKQKPYQQKRKQLETELQLSQSDLEEVLKTEKEIEKQQKEIEEKEGRAQDFEEKHSLERKRWLIEQKRRDLEKEKWDKEDKFNKLQGEVSKIASVLEKFSKEEQEWQRKKQEILRRLESMKLQEEREAIMEKIKTLKGQGGAIMLKRERLSRQKNGLETKLKIVREEEASLERETKEIGEKEKKVGTLAEQKELVQARWHIEERRKQAESKRWLLEKDLIILQKKISVVSQEEKQSLEQENSLRKRIEEIEAIIGYSPEEEEAEMPLALEKRPVVKEIVEGKPEEQPGEGRKIEISKVAEAKEEIKEEAKVKTVEEEQKIIEEIRWGAKAKEQEKIAESLRTKARALSQELAAEEEKVRAEKLKEIQERAKAKKEAIKAVRQVSKEEILRKLTQVSPEEEVERQEFLARVAGREKPSFKVQEKEWEAEVVFRPSVKKPSLLQKIFIRVLIVLLILGFITGVYLLLRTYVFQQKPAGVPSSVAPVSAPEIPPPPVEGGIATTTEATTTTAAGVTTTQPIATSTEAVVTSTPPIATTTPPATTTQPLPPSALFPVAGTEILSFATSAEIPGLLFDALRKPRPEKGFIRFLFQDVQAKTFLGLKEVFDFFEINAKEGFFENLIASSTLFADFSSKDVRVGFTAEVRDKTILQNVMKEWEKTIAGDFSGFFFLLAGKNVSFAKTFKSAQSKDVAFRYLDSSEKNLGICYASVDDLFLFTTSGESIIRLINLVNK